MTGLTQILVAMEAWLGRGLLALVRGLSLVAAGVSRAASDVATTLRRLPPSLRRGIGLAVVALALLFGLYALRDGPMNWYAAAFDKRPLLLAKTWHYQLDQINVDAIKLSTADLVVMDHAKNGGKNALDKTEVDRVRYRPDGSKRLVVSYMSIGEAEEFRYYWKPEWTNQPDKTKMPAWHKAANCAWPGAHAIRFWHPDWKKLIYGGPESFVGRIIKAGFDGVYLDRVDIYEQFTKELKNPEAEMVTFVTELAAAARAMKPGFMIISQNAEDLLRFKHYRRVIDGLGKEDLLHGHDGTGTRNKPTDIAWSQQRLNSLLADHKPVFAVEYLVTREAIADARAELKERGLVPTNAHRSLDGSDPTMPRFETKVTEGTPEYIKATCDKTNSW